MDIDGSPNHHTRIMILSKLTSRIPQESKGNMLWGSLGMGMVSKSEIRGFQLEGWLQDPVAGPGLVRLWYFHLWSRAVSTPAAGRSLRNHQRPTIPRTPSDCWRWSSSSQVPRAGPHAGPRKSRPISEPRPETNPGRNCRFASLIHGLHHHRNRPLPAQQDPGRLHPQAIAPWQAMGNRYTYEKRKICADTAAMSALGLVSSCLLQRQLP